LRNLIVHRYDEVEPSVVYGIISKRLEDVEKVKDQYLEVLKKERKTNRTRAK